MVTYTGSATWDIRGLAEDKEAFTADHTIPNGSTYYEIDGAHQLFMWDATGKTWVQQ